MQATETEHCITAARSGNRILFVIAISHNGRPSDVPRVDN